MADEIIMSCSSTYELSDDEGSMKIDGRRKYLRMIDKLQYMSDRVVNDPNTQNLLLALIIINSIMIGVGTFDFVENSEQIALIFESIDFLFLVVFSIELLLHFTYLGFGIFSEAWLVFDFIVIAISWLCVTMTVVRAMRVLRVLRLITHMKVMKQLLSAMMKAVPKLITIISVLFIIFYVYAVMCTELFKSAYKNGDLDQDYFTRLDKTLFTLFTIMTMDGWSTVAWQLMEIYPWSGLLFISFIIITSFIALNILIGVVVGSVRNVQEEEAKGIQNFFSFASQQESHDIKQMRFEIKASINSQQQQIDKLLDILERKFVLKIDDKK